MMRAAARERVWRADQRFQAVRNWFGRCGPTESCHQAPTEREDRSDERSSRGRKGRRSPIRKGVRLIRGRPQRRTMPALFSFRGTQFAGQIPAWEDY